jgi:transcriptional regulator with XRE-family HTH domain
MLSEDFARLFGEAVRRHRKAKGLTQEQLAERADLASKMISLIERFQRNPSVNVADNIARGLGVPLWRLVKDAEDFRRAERPSKRKGICFRGARPY